MCIKSGENLVIYSRRSYERGSGHSPSPPTQSRQCGNSANGEAEEGEENKQQCEASREGTSEARLTACAPDLQFHNPFGRSAIHMPTTEGRSTRQLSSAALNPCSKSNVWRSQYVTGCVRSICRGTHLCINAWMVRIRDWLLGEAYWAGSRSFKSGATRQQLQNILTG